MQTASLTPNKLFMNLTRRSPHSDSYEMILAIQLDGYKIREFDPNKQRYERRGGVNFRNTRMVLEPAKGHSELVVKAYNISANRKEEDAIHVELHFPDNDMKSTTSNVQAEQRSPGPGDTQPTSGGTTGGYEP